MRARSFFYVCLGLFLLMAGYSLGARRAVAQQGTGMEALDIDDYVNISYAIGHTYYEGVQCGGSGAPWCGRPLSAPIPGTSRVVATKAGDWKSAVLENGDVYFYENQQWTHLGNLLGGTINTESNSWGKVKAAFRR